MLLLGERPAYVDQLTDRLKKLSSKLFEGLSGGQSYTLSATHDLYELESSENLFIVKHGNLSGYHEDKLCLYYEAGDVIGLTNCYQLPSLRVAIEDQAEVIQFSADTLLRHVTSTKEQQAIWTSYMLTLSSLFQDAFGRSHVNMAPPSTGFLHFAAGQTIIEQGADAHDVFTILQGRADVFVDGTKVGEVLADEIFGAMAVFTGDKRSASVIAAETCTVLSVPREDFISLIQSHPQTTMTLIENLANKIKLMNEQLAPSA